VKNISFLSHEKKIKMRDFELDLLEKTEPFFVSYISLSKKPFILYKRQVKAQLKFVCCEKTKLINLVKSTSLFEQDKANCVLIAAKARKAICTVGNKTINHNFIQTIKP